MGDVDSEREKVVIKFAQKLAANEKKYRDRAVKKLQKWLSARSQNTKGGFSEDEMVKIWKGLHYCMWMCDKPLVQEELSVRIAQLVHSFNQLEPAFLFLRIFFETECREWTMIDFLRLDKFMMLMRHMLAQGFTLLRTQGWKDALITQLLDILSNQIINGRESSAPGGVKYHVADIYIEELTKVGAEQLSGDQVTRFLTPFVKLLQKADSNYLRNHIVDSVFETIVAHAVEDAEAENSQSDNEESLTAEKPARLRYDYQGLADKLFTAGSSKICKSRNRNAIYRLVKKFKDLSQGILPAGEAEEEEPRAAISRGEIENAIVGMQRLQKKSMRKPKKKKRKQSEETDNQEPAKKKKKTSNTDEDSDEDGKENGVHVNNANKTKKKGSLAQSSAAKKSKNKFKTSGDETGKKSKKNKEQKSSESGRDAAANTSLNHQGNEMSLFEGGFFDDEDEAELTAIKSHHRSNKLNDIVSMETENSSETSKQKDSKKNKKVYSTQLHSNSDDNDSETTGKKINHIGSTDGKHIASPLGGAEIKLDSINGLFPVEGAAIDKKAKKKRRSSSVHLTKSADTDSAFTNTHDEDCAAVLTSKSEKKDKKKEETRDCATESNGDLAVTNLSDSDPANSTVIDLAVTSDSKSKKKRRKSTGDIAEVDGEMLLTPKAKKVKKRKSLGGAEVKAEESQSPTAAKKTDTDNPLQEGEIEIWIPNKKYKGPKKSSSGVEICDKAPVAKSPPASPFAQFDNATATPSAFVRKSVKKTPPKTEPKNRPKSLLTPAEAKLRRVSFNLKHNKAQEFRDSLNLSPALPFNPLVTPEQGILKTPPISSMTPKLKRKVLKKRRASAADFF